MWHIFCSDTWFIVTWVENRVTLPDIFSPLFSSCVYVFLLDQFDVFATWFAIYMYVCLEFTFHLCSELLLVNVHNIHVIKFTTFERYTTRCFVVAFTFNITGNLLRIELPRCALHFLLVLRAVVVLYLILDIFVPFRELLYSRPGTACRSCFWFYFTSISISTELKDWPTTILFLSILIKHSIV